MSSVQRGLLAVALGFAVVVGCTETASIDNDRKGSTLKDAGTSNDDDDQSDDSSSSDDDDSSSSDDDSSSSDDDSSSSDDGSDDSSDDETPTLDAGTRDAGRDASTGADAGRDASTGSGTDAGKPATSTIAGSATKAKCSSYGEPKNGMCGSYYCGVTQEQIMSELPADTLCPDPVRVCDGGLVKAVGDCARSTKAANLTATNAQLKPKVQACVQKNPEFADLQVECIGCFLDVALCAGDKCLLECLVGDSAGCDSCRMKNNCEKPVFSCAKLPSPF